MIVMKIVPKCLLLTVFLFAASSTLTAGTIVSIDPNGCQAGQSISALVVGSGTHFQQGSGTLIWLSKGSSNIYSYGYYSYNNTQLIVWFDIPVDAEGGLYDLKVYNSIDGTLTLNHCFTITQYPALTSITPGAAKQGQSLTVTITGFSTNFGQATGGGGSFTQCTPTQGSPTVQGTSTVTTVTNVWLSQGSSTIDWIRGWPLYDTLFYALFNIPHDAKPGEWDLHVEFVQCSPATSWDLTLPGGFTIAQPGDITCDGAVNFFDVAVLSNHWLEGTEE
jgi:hypothetical protein